MDAETIELIKMIDAALISDNGQVKEALRSLLIITKITESEETGTLNSGGPLSELLSRLEKLESEISMLTSMVYALKDSRISYTPHTYTYDGTSTSTSDLYINSNIDYSKLYKI